LYSSLLKNQIPGQLKIHQVGSTRDGYVTGFSRAAADRAIRMDEEQIIEKAPPDILFTNPKYERINTFLSYVL